MYSGTSNIELFSVIATRSADGLTFNLSNIANWNITETGNINQASYSTIKGIWGLR